MTAINQCFKSINNSTTMKLKKTIIQILCCTSAVLAGCEEETGRVVYPYSSPEMSNLVVSATEQVMANSKLTFSVDIKDELTPLSTLEVSLTSGEQTIFSGSIRTKGNESSVKDFEIDIPFEAGLEDKKDAPLQLTAINVEGSETKEERKLQILRPIIPETLYLHIGDQAIAMNKSAENPYEYVTEVGSFPTQFTGKISSAQDIEQSDLIWGQSENKNYAGLVSSTSGGFNYNYQGWNIEQITFNTLTFKVGAIGTYEVYTINGVELEANAGCYQSVISFEKGQEVEVSGFKNLANAYNRDFFEYNPETGKLKFLRESGLWEVYYFSKYNYMWIARMDDIAPNAFWLVGHGFTSSPVWHEDYNSGGWDLDNISRMAYAVKVAENTYQATIYLNNTHEWASFEVEIYSDRQWDKTNGIELKEGSIIGDTKGFTISKSNGFTNTDEFVPGYYRITFDTSAGIGKEKMSVKKLTD